MRTPRRFSRASTSSRPPSRSAKPSRSSRACSAPAAKRSSRARRRPPTISASSPPTVRSPLRTTLPRSIPRPPDLARRLDKLNLRPASAGLCFLRCRHCEAKQSGLEPPWKDSGSLRFARNDGDCDAAMTQPATFSFDTPGDAERAAELRRVKALATLVLVSTLALFIVAKWLLFVHPVFGFIAAFAEAATIGGLADWYAVVALFKRPLGLPIPHTAIIQSNQQRIADKLGEFIEVHFLESAPVEAKLRQIDFGAFIADWLRDRKRSEDLARFTLRLLPEAVTATETSGLMTFIARRITSQLQGIDLAPLAAGTLRAFVKERRHQGLLDDILRAVHGSLTQAETMAMIREKIRDELPTLLKLYRADRFLVNKIVAAATAFFDEVRSDPQHPFRGEFDRMVLSFVDRLGTDQAYIG